MVVKRGFSVFYQWFCSEVLPYFERPKPCRFLKTPQKHCMWQKFLRRNMQEPRCKRKKELFIRECTFFRHFSMNSELRRVVLLSRSVFPVFRIVHDWVEAVADVAAANRWRSSAVHNFITVLFLRTKQDCFSSIADWTIIDFNKPRFLWRVVGNLDQVHFADLYNGIQIAVTLVFFLLSTSRHFPAACASGLPETTWCCSGHLSSLCVSNLPLGSSEEASVWRSSSSSLARQKHCISCTQAP